MPANLRSRVIRGCRLALLLVAAAAAFGPATAQAFTLISGTTKMYVNPAVGYTTSYVQVRATFKFGTSCPPPPVSFRFTFDGKAFWTRSVSTCNASTFLWDTGWSPYTKPPVTVSAGQHVIAVGVYSNTNVLFPGGTAQFAYTAVNPPASPVARPSPTPSPMPFAEHDGLPCGDVAERRQRRLGRRHRRRADGRRRAADCRAGDVRPSDTVRRRLPKTQVPDAVRAVRNGGAGAELHIPDRQQPASLAGCCRDAIVDLDPE